MRAYIAEIEIDVKQIKGENEALKSALDKFNLEKSQDLDKMQKDTLQKELNLLQSLKELKIEKSKLETDLKEVEEENQELVSRVEELTKRLETLNEEVETLQGDREQFEKAFEKLIEDKDLYNEKFNHLLEEHKDLEIENNKIKQELMQAENELISQANQLELFTKQESFTRRELQKEHEDKLEEQYRRLREDLLKEKRLKEEQENIVSGLRSELGSKKQDLQQLSLENNELKQQLTKLENTSKRTLEELTERHRKQVKDMQMDYEFMVDKRVKDLNSTEQSSELDWISMESKRYTHDEKFQMNFPNNVLKKTLSQAIGKDGNELYEARAKFLNELRMVESRYDEKIIEKTKEVLIKVKNEYKPLIGEYKSKLFSSNNQS